MRIYYLPRNKSGNRIIISDPRQIHHLADVLRLKRDDEVSAFDGKHQECLCQIEEISKDKVSLIIRKVKTISLSDKGIALACAIPKNVKIEYIIQKTTELGVSRIIPMHTKRTIVKIDPRKAQDKQKRWQRIAQEAAKQCKRISLPDIDPIREFEDVISEIPDYELAMIPNLEKGNKPIVKAAEAFREKSILFFIGPEGDFTPNEIHSAREKGCLSISLGDLTLKVDTAAIAVTAFLRFIRL